MEIATDYEVQTQIKSYLRKADGSWYDDGIQKFIVRTRKIIQGDYTEK